MAAFNRVFGFRSVVVATKKLCRNYDFQCLRSARDTATIEHVIASAYCVEWGVKLYSLTHSRNKIHSFEWF